MTNQNKLQQRPKIDQDYFENIIIYNALTSDTYLSSIIDHISPTFFKNSDIKCIMQIICEFYKSRGTPPTPTEIKTYLTTEELKSSFKTVVQNFKYLDSNFNKDELYENTERFFKEKAVYDTVLKTIADYSENNINTSETLTLFEKACSISLVDNLGHNYFKEIDKHCADLQTVYKYISSGWKWMDEKLGGGFLASGRALYIIAGFTNSGKSIFLGNMAVNMLKQNKTVVIISLEMSEVVYAKRISAQLTKLPLSTLDISTPLLKERLLGYKSEYPNAHLIIKEFPPKGITCNHIKAYIKKLKSKNINPDVIIVDYVNLINPALITPSSYENVKAVTEHLRGLSYTFEIPIISATQINRSGAGVANPGMEFVSESIGLTFTVDAQFAIWSNDEDKELGIIHMGVQKNRFGPAIGTTALKIDYETLTLCEIEDDYHATNAVKDSISSLDNMLNLN